MTQSEISNFLSICETKKKLAEEVQKYYGKELSPNFNSFEFWSLDENKISQIISFFLNPNKSHQQGDIYLKHFLKKFDLDFFSYGSQDLIDVECEYIIKGGRRIDIIINKNSFEQVIGIENKIHLGTNDQKNQLSDYLSFLKEKSNDNHCLIYLSPQNKTVSEKSIDPDERINHERANKIKLLSYENDIIECIKEFSLITENSRVRSFLEDFHKKLKKMYMGEKGLNSQQTIIDYINENEKNLEISLLIANSLQVVKHNLKQLFEDQIKEIANEMDIEVHELMLRPRNWVNHKICFNYESGGILYGIIRNEQDKNKTRLTEIEKLLSERLKDCFYVSYWWPMYQFFYRNIESNSQFWLDIYNGTAKKRAKTFIQLVCENFNISTY